MHVCFLLYFLLCEKYLQIYQFKGLRLRYVCKVKTFLLVLISWSGLFDNTHIYNILLTHTKKLLWIAFTHIYYLYEPSVDKADRLSRTDNWQPAENNIAHAHPSMYVCVFLSSRPHENIPHSTKDCSSPPEADQRSSSPQEHSYDPQWRRRWTHRTQPAGTTTVICSAISTTLYFLRYLLPCADLTLNCKISDNHFTLRAFFGTNMCWKWQKGPNWPNICLK